MKVSVICASFLGEYPNAASNREQKFIRAVKSFLNQTWEDKELIIVSDGCEITNKIYEENWLTNPNIKIFKSPKQTLYSGGIRSIGCKMASGEIICYLDNDDVLGKNHIKTIMDQFELDKHDWVYYDDLMVLNKEFTKFFTRKVEPRYGSIGTSSICHKNYFKNEKYKGKTNIPDWSLCTGYGHDMLYTMQMAAKGGPFVKLEKMPAYIVCHYKNGDF